MRLGVRLGVRVGLQGGRCVSMAVMSTEQAPASHDGTDRAEGAEGEGADGRDGAGPGPTTTVGKESELADALGRFSAWHAPREVLELLELAIDLGEARTAVKVGEEAAAAAERDGGLVVEDAEGTPVAVLQGALRPDPAVVESGLSVGRPFTHPPVRRHRRSPDQTRQMLDLLGAGPVFAVPVEAALSAARVEEVATLARHERARLLWLVLVGSGRRQDLPAEALLRAVRDAAADVEEAGVPGVVVPVAVPAGQDLAPLAHGYGADLVLPAPAPAPSAPRAPTAPRAPEPGPSARPRRAELHPASAREVDRSVPPPHRRGVTVFFTGLSGSGKSTLAKGLAEHLLDDGRREVTMLDGDEVRRMLSAGLGFGRADRDLNIRRIGWVAAEITRHGGLAICAPIAPFADVRAEVRAMVEDVGDFVLVHVATPLEECERRDRKGLYAKARAGLVAEFTGISSPYEDPDDADLVLDTSDLGIEEGVAAVWNLLDERGYLGEVDPRR